MTKTKISATIIADSKNEFGDRITSFVVKFPRIILAEFNTHRMFSRNSASSRAIPFEKMLKLVQEDPFIPIAWQKDHKGMQGTEYFNTGEKIKARVFDGDIFIRDVDETPEQIWLETRDKAILMAKTLSAMGVTKQLCNRLLEPFMWHTVIVTATEWENFFALRCPQYAIMEDESITFRSKKDCKKHLEKLIGNVVGNVKITPKEKTDLEWLKLNKGQAEIHAMALAEAMWDAYNESTPKQLKAGEWHIPFGDNMDADKVADLAEKLREGKTSDDGFLLEEPIRIKISTARNARVSYLNFEGKDDYEADTKLHDNLLSAGHMSCFEHCARAMNKQERESHLRGQVKLQQATRHTKVYEIGDSPEAEGWSGNFKGFFQYRKMIPGENRA